MSFTPAEIMAYADGELDALTARRIERAMESDQALRSQVEAHRLLRDRLKARFDPVLDEPVPSRVSVPLETVDTSLGARRARKAGLSRPAQWTAMAASLALALFTGYHLRPEQSVTLKSRGLAAGGALGRALETQLASSQGAAPAIRIGLTFRDRTGTVCRTFEAPSLSGIACKPGDDWLLRRTFEGARSQDYRLASSGEMAEAAARMMDASGPLGARAEASALEAGWKATPTPPADRR